MQFTLLTTTLNAVSQNGQQRQIGTLSACVKDNRNWPKVKVANRNNYQLPTNTKYIKDTKQMRTEVGKFEKSVDFQKKIRKITV